MLLSLNLKYTRECFKLALPVMLTQLGQVSVNLFDNMMVGNMLGANALASTALANSVFISIFIDRKSTRLNSSHHRISYAVFCLKKKREKLL